MSDDVDKSLLDRLQALRSSTTPKKPPSRSLKFDVIERARIPSRGDALTARLKSLRAKAEGSLSIESTSPRLNPRLTPQSRRDENQKSLSVRRPQPEPKPEPDSDVDALFQTDDLALEEMLADIDTPEPASADIEDVRVLLERLSASVPQDARDSDDSESEAMAQETREVMARYKDEVALDNKLPGLEGVLDDECEGAREPVVELPSAPDSAKSTSSVRIDDLTARMAALRQHSEMDVLPSVPTSGPIKSVKRLNSKTNYTDEDVNSWCTVCLEDATLRCLGCEDDVYCSRCWKEMHVGPAAHFDDWSHKAVQFTRDGKNSDRKIALGA